MACIYSEDADAPVVEIRIVGRVTQHDIDEILPKVEAFIAQNGRIRLLEIIEKFDGADASTMLDGLRFDMENLRNITHSAVVSDIGWIGFMTRAAGMVMPITIRLFGMDQVEAARAWAREVESDVSLGSPSAA